MSWACLFCFSSFINCTVLIVAMRVEEVNYDLSLKSILIKIRVLGKCIQGWLDGNEEKNKVRGVDCSIE